MSVQPEICLLLDESFRAGSLFRPAEELRAAAARLGAGILSASELDAFLREFRNGIVFFCHGGDFPGEAFSALQAFQNAGGDTVWLGGTPYEKEWLNGKKGWERGDPMDRGYPECPLERHESLGISPWWVAPEADLDPSEQRAEIHPDFQTMFGRAVSFVINGQVCQLMPRGAGRRVVIGSVIQGGSTYNRNDVIAMVESGRMENTGGGRIVCAGFRPGRGWTADMSADLMSGIIRFLERDASAKLKVGVNLQKIAAPQDAAIPIEYRFREGQSPGSVQAVVVDMSGQTQAVVNGKDGNMEVPTGSLSPGRYELRFQDEQNNLGLKECFSVIKPKGEIPDCPETVYAGSYAAFRLEGKLCPMQTYSAHASHRTFETLIPGFRDAGIHVYHLLIELDWGWNPSGEHDWSRHDAIVARILQEDPDAYLFPRVGMAPPAWWVKEHPESAWRQEAGLSDDISGRGPARYMSYYDPAWRHDTVQILTAFLQHVRKSWYGHRLLGIFPQYGYAGEWGEEPKEGLFWADHHPEFVRWFRKWLKQKYKTDEALRDAWSKTGEVDPADVLINNSQFYRLTNPEHHLLDNPQAVLAKARQVGPARIAEAQVPNFFRRRVGKHGIIRDPAQSRDVIDFLEAYSQGYALFQKELSDAVKDAGQGQILVGTFAGYYTSGPYETDGGYISVAYPYFLDITKKLDLLCTANFYYRSENPTGDQVCHAALESYRLHGKPYLSENDQRTCLAGKIPSTKYGTPNGDLWESLGSMKRNWLSRVVRGAGLWWFDFAQGYYDHPEMIALLKKLQDIYVRLIREPNLNAFNADLARCAVLYSAQAYVYTVIASNYLRRVAECQLQTHFNRYGIPAELYFPEDMDRMPVRRVYLFLNAFYLSEKHRKIINQRFKRDGNILIWLYAPGIINENGYAIENTSELTGFKLESAAEWRKQRIEMTNHGHPVAQSLVGHDLGDFGSVVFGDTESFASPEMDRISPQIFVSPDDREAVPLGVLEGTDRIGFAVKKHSDWTSVYASAAMFPAAVMRAVLKWAGVELQTDGLDNFYTNGDLLGLNSLKSEYKTIRFPSEFQIEDLMSGEVYHSRNREVKIWVRYRDTFLGQVSKKLAK